MFRICWFAVVIIIIAIAKIAKIIITFNHIHKCDHCHCHALTRVNIAKVCSLHRIMNHLSSHLYQHHQHQHEHRHHHRIINHPGNLSSFNSLRYRHHHLSSGNAFSLELTIGLVSCIVIGLCSWKPCMQWSTQHVCVHWLQAGHCCYVIVISRDVWACWMIRCLFWRSPEVRGTVCTDPGPLDFSS